jgi:DNA-binding NtrC family response regulator
MDDEAQMRNVIENMLVALGFTVDTAENGEEAVSKYKNAMESGNPYNMVLLDLIIPGEAGGITTLSDLEKLDPDVKGIITSGYAKNLKMDDYETRAFKAYLKKPFSISDLNKTILHVMK